MDVPYIMKRHSRFQMFIHNKDNLKILESLTMQTLDDILHILISPGRDNYTEFHTYRLSTKYYHIVYR